MHREEKGAIFSAEDGATVALSIIDYCIRQPDGQIFSGELFVGDPAAEDLYTTDEHMDWLFKLPEFYSIIEAFPAHSALHARFFHFEVPGCSGNRRGATAKEMSEIIVGEFPNGELEVHEIGGESTVMICPIGGIPEKPKKYPHERYIVTHYEQGEE